MKRRVEAEVTARFPAALFDRMIEHHCRKGIRPDCGCDFCRYKRYATTQFSFLRRRYAGGRSEADGGGKWDGDQEYRIRAATKEKRREVRAELNRIKGESI